METLLRDIRYGVRSLLKRPGFTVVALIALALGIGANTAIFSVVNAVLLRHLPYQEPDRLVIVWEANRIKGDNKNNVVSPGNFLSWRDQNKVFSDMAGYVGFTANLTGTDKPEEISGQAVTTNFLSTLGANPLMGRSFLPEEDQEGKDNVFILSYSLWQRRFGGDKNIVGKTVSVNRNPITVVGVMPQEFDWYISEFAFINGAPEFWTPVNLPTDRTPRGRYLSVVARLKPGITQEQAQAEMNTIASRLEQTYPEFDTGWGTKVIPLNTQLTGDVRPVLLMLLASVGFVLLIACANVATLLLARAASRQKELAIRAALGAGRWRVIRQLLTESLLLSGLGGILGVVLAVWSIGGLLSLAPRNLIAVEKVTLNTTVLIFSCGVSILTGLLFGLAPAFITSRHNLNNALKDTGKGVSGGSHKRANSIFVVVEVGLALVLLISAGLLIKSLWRLQSVETGFNAENLLTMRVVLPRRVYGTDEKKVSFVQQTVQRLQTLTGVKSAAAVASLPFGGLSPGTTFLIEGQPTPQSGQEPVTDVVVTGPNYFQTMQIPLMRGRFFDERELTKASRVVIINETLAREHFPNEDPLGKKLTIYMKDDNQPCEIIGVVRDVRQKNFLTNTRDTIYWPHPELALSSMTFVLRTEAEPMSLAASAEQTIHNLDKDLPVSDIRPMSAWLAESTAKERFSSVLLTIFAAVALLLAAVGLYGVLAYSVTQRTQELGVRIALGAKGSDIFKLILGQGMLLTCIGLVLGLIAAFGLTRLLKSLLFGVKATDPVTFIVIGLLLMLVAFLACYIPARRATKVNPLTALRYE
jgi:putative ABC transport system permease protein